MPAQPEHLALGAEFPAASREQWRALVTEVLRRSGRGEQDDPEAELSSTTYDGIVIRPLYTADDAHGAAPDRLPGQPPFIRGGGADGATRRGWDVRQRHADPDPDRTRTAALADLANGASSLWVVVGDGGLRPADLAGALEGVDLDRVPIALDAGGQTLAASEALLGLRAKRGLATAQLAGTLGADPIGLRARTGAGADLALLGELAAAADRCPDLRVATVDGTVYHDAGGSDSDELGVAAAVGVAYLRALSEAGLAVDAALGLLEFRYAVTADQFLSIAKLRAARRVWDRIAELSGAGADRTAQRQHAVTSAAMMTQRDPWVNLLRTTIACFAAAVGGADAITAAPFDAAIGLPDELARRLARNTQSILHDESSLARVSDPAGGSWYVASLTDALAERAWMTFTAIERSGGALAALDDGTVERLLAGAREARAADIAHRRAAITGVSEFAFLGESPVVREAAAEQTTAPAQRPSPALPRQRYAQPFEALRDRADAAGSRPTVFLAALGPVAAYRARVGFAANLFRSGGIEPIVGSGDLGRVLTAFRASGSAVACLCSANRIYATEAITAARALKAAGASYVWLAGPPGDFADVDGYLFAGVDALSVLGVTLELLGVA